jgi:hypothetical protein
MEEKSSQAQQPSQPIENLLDEPTNLANPNFSLDKNAEISTTPQATPVVTDPVETNPVDIMSRLNLQTERKQVGSELNLASLSINASVKKESNITLGDSGIQMNFANRNYKLRYRNIFMFSLVITVLCSCISLVLGVYDKYMYIASQAVVDPQYESYISTYKDIEQMITDQIAFSDYPKYRGLSLEEQNAEKNIQTIVNASGLNYIQKKDLLQEGLNGLMSKYVSNRQKLESLRQDVTKYGFFSKELFGLLENEEYITSIKDSLLSLEMIKFSTAIKVFSYLDTFVSSLGNILSISTSEVNDKMAVVTQRGEKDILVYLNSCYLNPYEIDANCNLVGDFDRYYTQIDKEKTNLDRNFFKKLIEYVDLKLEQTDIPSFAITFQKFNPNQKEVSFSVEVNSTQQDELALTQKGIINPHIFIVSNLLNLIKQSLFVVGENIDAKKLKIQTKTVKLGSSVFTLHSSIMNFVLPVQKSTAREITDYTSKDLLESTSQ